MKEYNLKELLENNTAVNCKTKKQVKNFFKYLHSQGYVWEDGDILDLNNLYHNICGKESCYEITSYGTIIYGDIDYFKNRAYKIIQLKDIKIKKGKNI